MGDGRCWGRAWLEQSVNHCTATLDLASARCNTQTASRKQTALLTQCGPSRHTKIIMKSGTRKSPQTSGENAQRL